MEQIITMCDKQVKLDTEHPYNYAGDGDSQLKIARGPVYRGEMQRPFPFLTIHNIENPSSAHSGEATTLHFR